MMVACASLVTAWSPAVVLAEEGRGAVAGTVTIDGRGTPAANVEVRLVSGRLSTIHSTDREGRYTFDQLLPGTYSVRIVPPDGMRASGDATVGLTVVAGRAPARADFTLAAIAAPATTPTVPPAPAPASANASALSGQQTPPPSSAAVVPPAASPAPATPPASDPVAVPSSSAGDSTVGLTSPRASDSMADGQADEEAPAAPAVFLPPGTTRGAPPSSSPEPLDADLAVEQVGEPPRPPADGAPADDAPAEDAPAPVDGPPVPAEDLAPAVSEPPRRVIASFAELKAGGAEAGAAPLRAMTTDTSLMLAVPFRTQIDGTEYSLVNCGPASLAMVLAAFGLDVDPASIRDYLNYLVGNYDTEQGTSLYVLSNIAREAGLNVFTSARGGLQGWTVEDVRRHVGAGHPVITLTKYRKLPGRLGSQTDFDHYVVITGLAGDDFVYNDAAYASEYGRNLLISPAELEQAWADSSNPRHAVALGLGDGIRPLPTVPRRLLSETSSEPKKQEQEQESAPWVTATPRPVRPPALERLRDRLLENLGARSALVDPSRSPSSE